MSNFIAVVIEFAARETVVLHQLDFDEIQFAEILADAINSDVTDATAVALGVTALAVVMTDEDGQILDALVQLA